MTNIYDFDKTIYDGDSSIDFFKFCLKKNKKMYLLLPKIIIFYILFCLNLISKEKLKECFFSFLVYFDNIDELVNEFWIKNEYKIKEFYLNQKKKNDIIISASPDFLLRPITKKLGITKLIASNIDKKTGKYTGKNCSGEEKVNRLKLEYDNIKVNSVYSDSKNDLPILKLGKKSYLVKGNKLKEIDAAKTKKCKGIKLIDLILYISCPFLLLFIVGKLNKTDTSLLKYLVIFVFLFGIFITNVIRKKLSTTSFNKKMLVVSLILSLFFTSCSFKYSYSGILLTQNVFFKILHLSLSFELVTLLIILFSLPILVLYIYFILINLIPFLKKEYKILTTNEKKFIIYFTIFGFFITLFIYSLTSAFSCPEVCNDNICRVINYDVIYTSDSGTITSLNAYMDINSPENDFRQPLFALFSLPFSLTAKFLSNFILFIPNAYLIILNTINFLLLSLIILMLCRIFNLEEKNKKIFIVLLCSSFPFMLFSLVMEQYVVSTFYLVLMLYVWFKNKPNCNYSYLGAVGTLVTSGIFLPLISPMIKNKFLNYLKQTIKLFIIYLFLICVTGRIFCFSISKIQRLLSFGGAKVTLIDKLRQFIYFVKSIFFGPGIGVIKDGSYLMHNINTFHIIGILLLVVCVISFIINFKKIEAKLSFFWILFSVLILIILGWGTSENGLILYSLYFSWAYIYLIFEFINKLFKGKTKMIIYLILIILMIIFNLRVILSIIKFALKFYRI